MNTWCDCHILWLTFSLTVVLTFTWLLLTIFDFSFLQRIIEGSVKKTGWIPLSGTHNVKSLHPWMCRPDYAGSVHQLPSPNCHLRKGQHPYIPCPHRQSQTINPKRRTFLRTCRKYWTMIQKAIQKIAAHLHHWHPLFHNGGCKIHLSMVSDSIWFWKLGY